MPPEDPKVTSPTETEGGEGSEGEKKAEEPDYRALYEESQAEGIKKDKDLSSIRGTVRSQSDVRAEATAQIESLQESILALARAQEAGKSEGLTQSLTEISTAQAAKQSDARFKAQYESLWSDLEEAVKGEDGSPLLDLKTAPELEAMRTLWDEGADGKGLDTTDRMGRFQRAISLTHQVVRAEERKTARTAAQTAKTEKHEEDVKDLDNDTGNPVAGAAMSLEALMQKAQNRPERLTQSERKELLGDFFKKMSEQLGVTLRPPQVY